MIAAGGGKRPVACVNAQQFIDELIVALQEGTIERWRARYRLVDALLIDDVQLCATGERTQEELFHVFNSLYSAGKQVVLGADRAPRLIERLEDRLRSRFEGGLVVEIQPPDHSLREKLYARMFAAAGQHADRVLVDFLSARAVANVAELAATVDRLVKAAGVVGVPLNASFARKELEGGGFAPAPARVIDGREADSFFLDEEKVVWDWPDVGRPRDRGPPVMAIKGSLKEASLPDVLQLLAMGQKTGCLSVADRNNFGYIYFDRGRISYASIVNRRDRLGDLLVKHGVVTQLELDVAIEAQSKAHRGKRLGEILIEQQILTREELHRYIRVQIEEAVYYLFTWTQGTFSFEADMRPEEQRFPRVDQSRVAAAGRRAARGRMESDREEGADASTSSSRWIARGSRRARRSSRRRRSNCIPLIDGRRDVTTLIEESGIGEFEVGKALYGLVDRRAICIARASRAAVDDARARGARRRAPQPRHRVLQDRDARRGRARVPARGGTERDRRARAILSWDSSRLREGKWSEAVLTLREAGAQPNVRPAVFHNLAYALERMGHYDDAREALQEAIQRGGQEDPRIRTSLGVLALKSGDVDEADALLTASRLLWASGRRRRRGSTTPRSLPRSPANSTVRSRSWPRAWKLHPHAAVLLQQPRRGARAARRHGVGGAGRGTRAARGRLDPAAVQESWRLPLSRVAL